MKGGRTILDHVGRIIGDDSEERSEDVPFRRLYQAAASIEALTSEEYGGPLPFPLLGPTFARIFQWIDRNLVLPPRRRMGSHDRTTELARAFFVEIRQLESDFGHSLSSSMDRPDTLRALRLRTGTLLRLLKWLVELPVPKARVVYSEPDDSGRVLVGMRWDDGSLKGPTGWQGFRIGHDSLEES